MKFIEESFKRNGIYIFLYNEKGKDFLLYKYIRINCSNIEKGEHIDVR